MPSSNPRYNGAGGWKARNRVLQLVRTRAANGECCAICGQPIDLTAPQWITRPEDGKRIRAPWSLECDELVPISRGGSPTDPANVRPVHRLCNQRRGNRADSQPGRNQDVPAAPTSAPVPHDIATSAGASRW